MILHLQSVSMMMYMRMLVSFKIPDQVNYIYAVGIDKNFLT